MTSNTARYMGCLMSLYGPLVTSIAPCFTKGEILVLPIPMAATAQIPIANPAIWRRKSSGRCATGLPDTKIKIIQPNCTMTRMRAFILSAVICRLKRLFDAIFDYKRSVYRRKAPNRAGAVNGFIHFAVWSENKACRMYEAPHIIKKSPCHGAVKSLASSPKAMGKVMCFFSTYFRGSSRLSAEAAITLMFLLS